MEPNRFLLEGSSLEELKARILAEYGADARIVAAEQVTVGGIRGFFARRHIEVTVEVPARQRRASHSRSDVQARLGIAALLDDADAAEARLYTAAEPRISTVSEGFADLMDELTFATRETPDPVLLTPAAPAAPRSVDTHMTAPLGLDQPGLTRSGSDQTPAEVWAAEWRAVDRAADLADARAAARAAHRAAARAADRAADRAAYPAADPAADRAADPAGTVYEALSSPLSASASPARTGPTFAERAADLLFDGVDAPRAHSRRDARTRETARTVAAAAVPRALTGAGDLVIVVGWQDAALPVTRELAPDDGSAAVFVAGAIDAGTAVEAGLDRILDRRTALEARARGVELGKTSFVAFGLGSDASTAGIHASLLVLVRPDQVWVVVDAGRKPADTARWVAEVARSLDIDAVAVTGYTTTGSPESVDELGIPVGWVDGVPATSSTVAGMRQSLKLG
ncbi:MULTISPECIES: hypothetical protein [Cryobacterium]|uniref:Uncharacterized protein n=1 Tax=Cryobacterium breve TaxID=1259258 RepID=A0ABY2IYV6_9MICO|nr:MULTISPECIES: hypothetical protein [Cryobacterium]TFC96626.1 hypothetical protein E3T20_01025 [Cryobacterium sp. TmT3-12]TFC97577.1 hypothetical protein E3O65_12475 [Cryobacterium breve]